MTGTASGPSFPRVLALALGALALFLHPGVYLNDEVAQVIGLHNLAEGSILVQPGPPIGYAEFDQGLFGHGGVQHVGEPAAPLAGSALLNVLGLPVLAVLTLVDALTSTLTAISVAGALLVGAGARAAFGMAGRPMPRWAWGAVALAFFPQVWREDLPRAPYLELTALTLVSMVATAFAAALLYDLLQPKVGQRTAVASALLYVVATPAMFWGLNVKYHALSMAFVATALWAYQAGAATEPRRTALAYAIAGLAVATYLPIGALLLMAMALVSLPAVRLGLAPTVKRAVAAMAGLAFGLLPEVIYRWAVDRASEYQYVIGVGIVDGSGQSTALETARGTAGLLVHSLAGDPATGLLSIVRSIGWTHWFTDGPTLPFLALAPWAVLAGVAVARADFRRTLGNPLVALALAHIAVVLFFLGRVLLATPGYDPRYAATVWPCLVVLAAPALRGVVESPDLRAMVRPLLVLLLGLTLFGMVLNMVLHALGMSLTPQLAIYDELLIPRLTGLACALGLAAAWLGRRGADWKHAWALVAVATAATTQILLQLAFANKTGHAPYAAWPLDAVSRFVYWMLFKTYVG